MFLSLSFLYKRCFITKSFIQIILKYKSVKLSESNIHLITTSFWTSFYKRDKLTRHCYRIVVIMTLVLFAVDENYRRAP